MTVLNKKKLLIFTSSLAGGGAEKHLLRILPYLQEHYQTTLALCRHDGELAKEISPATSIIELGKGRCLKALIPLIIYLKKHQPDLVFSVQDHANAIAIIANYLSFNNKTKVICSIQNNFSISRKTTTLLRGKILYSLLPFLYPYASSLIACSNGLKTNILQNVKISSSKVTTIYNAAYEPIFEKLKDDPCDEPWLNDRTLPVIISCGRLVPQKNYSLLLHAFKDLIKSVKARLIIVGNGPEKAVLEKIALNLDLIDKVKFIPFTMNHYQLMGCASIFVLPSRWEGFGNVIVEAMACEVPVISSDCSFGPNEIIDNNKDGLLFENNNQKDLTQKMAELLNNQSLRQKLIQNAKEKCKLFSSENIAAQHLSLFDSLL